MSSLTKNIDVYCERTDFTFWSEPLNALSNIAFFIAAYFCWQLYEKSKKTDIYAASLIVLLALTGVGSFLFHTFATRWAGLADMIPILLMVLVYHVAVMHRIGGFSLFEALFSLIFIPVLSVITAWMLPDMLGTSKAYTPVLILFGYYYTLYRSINGQENYLMAIAAGVFSVSLLMRIADEHVCSYAPQGLHYFWHIFNAITLYLAFRVYRINTK